MRDISVQHAARSTRRTWCLTPLLVVPPTPQVLWDLASGQPICGSPAHKQNVECVKFFKRDPTKIITAGNSNLQVGAAGSAATLAAARALGAVLLC